MRRLIITILSIPLFFYHFICEMTMNGQSIGKRLRNIRVMRADGRQAAFSNYFLRFLIRPIDTIYIIGLAFVFITNKGQRLGDLAAGTVIVDIRKELADPRQMLRKPIEKSEIIFPEVHQLTDENNNLLPRRAGISSFGFGGANGHVFIEEYVSDVRPVSFVTHDRHVFVLSAKNGDRLREYAGSLVQFVRNNKNLFMKQLLSI